MCLVPAIIALSLSSGAADPAARKPAPETPVWLASLPATFSQPVETAAVEVHGCRISIGTALEAPPFPPLFHVWVRKEGCETGGYVLLGTSFSTPGTQLDARKQAIVATFTFRETPSGSAFEKAQVVALDFESGVTIRSVTLAALPPFGSGLVEPTSVQLRGNSGTVIVRGTKNGVIPGEQGEGDEFIALFDNFTRGEFVPPRVIAF